jgi:CHAD domain-containing protein
MPYTLQQDEPIDGGMKRIAEEQVSAAIKYLEANKFYEARKNLKRVRAVLRLLKPQLGPVYQEENRRMRDAAQRFSASRDADVSLEVLETFASHYKRKSTLDPQRQALMNKRQAVDPAESMHELEGTRKRIEDWPLSQLTLASLELQLEKTFKQSRNVFRHARKTRTVEDFHEFRKSVKREVNQLKLLRPEESRIAELKKLGDALGDHHNLAVMLSNLDQVSGRFRQLARRQQKAYEEHILTAAGKLYEDAAGRPFLAAVA